MTQKRRMQLLVLAVMYFGISDLAHADRLVPDQDSNRYEEDYSESEESYESEEADSTSDSEVTNELSSKECLPLRDPHSLACQEAIFQGQYHPIFGQVEQRIQGRWRPMFFNSIDASEDFRMILDPRVPFQSLGVLNYEDGSRVGDLIVSTDKTRFMNWRSQREALLVLPKSIRALDDRTYEFKLADMNADQGFQCRVYGVQGAENLLCRWLENREGSYTLRGYFGFRRSDER